MAQYNGFKCDFCGAVFDPEERTKITTRFEGVINGYYSQDACPECAQQQKPNGVELRPLRKRGSAANDESSDTPVVAANA